MAAKILTTEHWRSVVFLRRIRKRNDDRYWFYIRGPDAADPFARPLIGYWCAWRQRGSKLGKGADLLVSASSEQIHARRPACYVFLRCPGRGEWYMERLKRRGEQVT